MNVGDVVGLIEMVEGVAKKVPAIVTEIYKNAHGEVVADLHKLEATIHGVVSSDDNPPEAVPTTGPVVTSSLEPLTAGTPGAQQTPPAAPAAPVAAVPGSAAAVAQQAPPADAPDETDPELEADFAAFLAWRDAQKAQTTTTETTSTSTSTQGDGSPTS